MKYFCSADGLWLRALGRRKCTENPRKVQTVRKSECVHVKMAIEGHTVAHEEFVGGGKQGLVSDRHSWKEGEGPVSTGGGL